MQETHFYEPVKGHRLAHDPLKAIIAPRPIGWISTVDREGRVNLAPYSFFNGIGDNPPMVMFAGEDHKDSIRNAEETGEFVFNLVTAPFMEAMNTSSATVPHGINEMKLAGLKAASSSCVKPPRVAGITAALECKTIYVHHMRDVHGTVLKRTVVMGQVVGVHIDPAFLRDGIFDTAAARPIARCGYKGDYAEVTELFQMFRPTTEETRRLLERELVD
jgi:flavin reductase (DIM6/NTAB) family NADH-FMN oxidoreductase RutF